MIANLLSECGRENLFGLLVSDLQTSCPLMQAIIRQFCSCLHSRSTRLALIPVLLDTLGRLLSLDFHADL